MRNLALFLIPVLSLAVAGHAFADTGLVKLKESRPLMKGVDALPRLFSGAKPTIIKRINATLAQIDAQERQWAQDCVKDAGNDYGRSTEVTMRGPRYLSLVAHSGGFCGGAHDNAGMQALVFDLNTGALADWEKLLPGKVRIKSLGADLKNGVSSDSALSSEAIWDLYKKQALAETGSDPSCADAFDEQRDFEFYLDAKKNAVAVDAIGLRHAVRACGATLYLTGDILKSLGASQDLITSLATAHRLLR